MATAERAVYVISVAAELSGLHPQTLRTYERMGLITPARAGGGARRYTPSDVDLLRTIAELTAAGIGIEGVRRILDLEDRILALTSRNSELQQQVRDLAALLERAANAPRRSNLPAVRDAIPLPPRRHQQS